MSFSLNLLFDGIVRSFNLIWKLEVLSPLRLLSYRCNLYYSKYFESILTVIFGYALILFYLILDLDCVFSVELRLSFPSLILGHLLSYIAMNHLCVAWYIELSTVFHKTLFSRLYSFIISLTVSLTNLMKSSDYMTKQIAKKKILRKNTWT